MRNPRIGFLGVAGVLLGSWGLAGLLPMGLGGCGEGTSVAALPSEGGRDPGRNAAGSGNVGEAGMQGQGARAGSDGAERAGRSGVEGGGPGQTDAPEDLEWTDYEADDENLLYSGRIDFSDPKRPKFSAPAVTITTRFRGSGVALQVQDEHKWGSERNFFDVVIDGERTKVAPERAETRIEVTTDLPYGEHDLVIAKRTESSLGYVEFLGLEILGEILEPPDRPRRKLIFIGDSILAGAGAEGINGDPMCDEDAWGEPGGWGQPYHNANVSFGPVLARALEAEYHVEAVSGIGMVRNYSAADSGEPMPAVYDRLFLEQEDSPEWDHSDFDPDAIVIALGTNDFSPGDNERDPNLDVDEYTAAYVEFVDRLQDYHPEATIFCLSSPMLSDGWPAADDRSNSNLKQAVQNVADHYESEGVDGVHAILVDRVIMGGCDSHPSVAKHEAIAEQVQPEIASVMGW